MDAVELVACHTIRLFCRVLAARRLAVRIEGLDNLPRTGPVLIACRHYHHLYDGVVLLGLLPRPVHLVVALDWVRGRRGRRLMELACRLAGWPVVLRGDGPELGRGASAYRATEGGAYLRRALRDVSALLRVGRILVIFPEAYPNVDPVAPLKRPGDGFLPFRPGFVRLIEAAQRDGRTRVAVVPAGLEYRRRESGAWGVTLRLGPPRFLQSRTGRDDLVRRVEDEVRLLSGVAV